MLQQFASRAEKAKAFFFVFLNLAVDGLEVTDLLIGFIILWWGWGVSDLPLLFSCLPKKCVFTLIQIKLSEN
jgi:hypothetical protein